MKSILFLFGMLLATAALITWMLPTLILARIGEPQPVAHPALVVVFVCVAVSFLMAATVLHLTGR